MSDVSEANRQLARYIAGALGGSPKVTRFWDEPNRSHVDILCAADAPQKGVRSYSTLGLSDWPLYRDGKDFGVRIELVGACGANQKHFDNALSTAAFNIINSKWFCAPGVIFPDVLAMYKASKTMRHFLFVPPFLWGDAPEPQHVGGKRVDWLMAVPVSDDELALAKREGPAKLEDIFLQEQIDVFDLARKSVV
jgi:antitoxin YqcF